jgi:glyceraldehyde 3-phosphate dehydrogenase
VSLPNNFLQFLRLLTRSSYSGHGTRVPNNNVSYVVLNLVFDQPVSRHDLVQFIQEASQKPEYKDLLAWNEAPLVSGDFCGRKESAIVDFNQLDTCHGLVQLPAWFDNEWGYSRRLCELLGFVANQDRDQKKSGHVF